VLAAFAARGFAFGGVLATGEIDDLGTGSFGDLVQFGPADEGLDEVQVVLSLHGYNGKARLACALTHVAAFADKDFGHLLLLFEY